MESQNYNDNNELHGPYSYSGQYMNDDGQIVVESIAGGYIHNKMCGIWTFMEDYDDYVMKWTSFYDNGYCTSEEVYNGKTGSTHKRWF